MSEHTREPWKHVETRVYLGNEGGFDLRGSPAPEANARRIVACVNACAGIPTEVLERNPSSLESKQLLKFYAAGVEQQRDKLLAALKATLPLLRGHQETPEKVARYSNALAAIAEIETTNGDN